MRVDIPQEFFEATPIIIAETRNHVIVAVKLDKATLNQHRRFIEMLLEASAPGKTMVEDDE
jgi:hypothetical protein